MLRITRYVAFVVLALLSVTFFAVWLRSFYRLDAGLGPSYLFSERSLAIYSYAGKMDIGLLDDSMTVPRAPWQLESCEVPQQFEQAAKKQKWYFRAVDRTEWELSFPTWFPGAITGLLAIAVLRFNRRFSVRSAMFGTTAIAILLGMVVASLQGEQ
jgi:hypothetical protein